MTSPDFADFCQTNVRKSFQIFTNDEKGIVIRLKLTG